MDKDLLELCIQRFSRLFGLCEAATPPTKQSIARIETKLGFRLPPDFVYFAAKCPSYRRWFASIGADYDSPTHILGISARYRSPEYGSLPSDLVVINHGYDGDLSCYDLSNRDEEGRFSICYCSVSEDEYENPPFEDVRRHLGYSICEYLVPSLDWWEKIRNERAEPGATDNPDSAQVQAEKSSSN